MKVSNTEAFLAVAIVGVAFYAFYKSDKTALLNSQAQTSAFQSAYNTLAAKLYPNSPTTTQ